MSEFVVPPSNTLGVKLPDNTVYMPDSRGTINVTNRQHIAQIKASNAKQNMDMITEKSYRFAGDSDSNRCGKCMFAAHNFCTKCPRCGNQLKEDQ